MNNIHKYKTSFIAKATTLASLLIFLSIGTAWGQQTTIRPGTHTFQCDTTYNYKATEEGTYTFQNNTGRDITISVTVNTLRYYRYNENYNVAFDFVKIGNTEYGNNTTEGYNYECYEDKNSRHTFRRTENNVTVQIASDSTATFEIEKNISSNRTGECSAGFSFTVTTPPCCPECPTLTEELTTADGDTSATLSWGQVSSTATYSVAVTQNGTPYNDGMHSDGTYSAGTDESLTLDSLPNGTYTWTLTFIVEGCTFSCKPRTFYVIDNLDCIDQSGLVPQNGTVLGSRWVSWNPVPYADKYTIYLAPTSVGIGNVTNPSSAIYTTTTTSTEHLLPMIPQGDYYWTVIPENTALGIKATDCPINTFTIRYASAEDHDIAPSTQGKEFYFSLMENGYYNFTAGCGGRIHKYTAVIAPKENGTVTFKYYAAPTGNDTRTFTVTAGQTVTVDLPEEWVYHPTPGEDLNRTVYVESTADISLYIANEACNSFDASIVLPTHALGTEYMLQNYHQNENSTTYTTRPCFMVIATQDNTDVEISGGNSGSITPDDITVTLHKGQSYFVISDSYATDLSGVKVSVKPRVGYPEDSCKTIAVFNGNTLTNVPNNRDAYNMDHIFEQAYPVSNWGTKFAITSSLGWDYTGGCHDYQDVEYIRITAAEATALTFGGTVYPEGGDNSITTDNLIAGQTKTYRLHRTNGVSCYIESTKPVACYLYQRSGCSISGPNGDPSMIWMAPIERGIEKITFSTFAATDIDNANHYVNIVIPADALDIRTSGRDDSKTVWLGDRDITREFQTGGTLNYVKGSNYKYAYARVMINHGTYTVASNCGAKMVFHVYGVGNVRGYAYNAGSAAVPYKSAFTIGDGEKEFDMTALPTDYHFCSGQEYVFRVSSNGDMDSVIFDFQNGERKTLKNISPTNNTIHHTITQSGDYRITSYVFSTAYNHDLCQKEIVVDTVEDHTYIFLSKAETVNDSVCYNTPYTYTRTYWVYDSEGNLDDTTFTHNFNTAYESDTTLHIDDAKSQYGCDIDLTINLKIFGQMKPGTIGSRKIKCQEGTGGSVNLSVTELTDSVSASGGPSDAHYEWQKGTIVSVSGTDTTWNWTTISGQTEATYIVVEAGYYRRVYKSAFCNQEYYSNKIFVQQAGSFNPGDHIDETIEVCNYQTVTRDIGGNIASSSILGNATDGYYVVVPNGETTDTIYLSFQWQKAEGTLPATDAGWTDITTDGNDYNYSINSTFIKNTYFRRLIDATGFSCELNLSMGVFGIVVKPDYNVSIKKLSGCNDQNNAKAVFDIKYADSTTGNFNISYAGPEGTTSGTAVANGNKYETGTMYQDVVYTYTVVDATYGCEKTGTVNIANPDPLTVADAESKSACQGSPIYLPIPAISGGDKPYSVTITSTGLGITEARSIQVEVNTNDDTTTSYNVPMDVTPEAKTLGYVIRDVNNCRVASDQTVVTIEKVPAFDLSNTELSSCEADNVNATITATVTNATGSPKYDYQIDYGNFNDNDKASATHTFGSTTLGGGLPQGVYNITVIDENTSNKCSASKEHEIKSNFVPTVVLVVPELTMVATNQYSGCPNKNITVSVSAINGTAIGNIAENTYQYSIDGTNYDDEYSFQATTSNKCGSQTISVYVKEVSTGCVFKQDLSIIIEDGIDPTIDASLTNMDVTTYFCPTYTVPKVEDIKNNIKAYIHDNCASDDDLSVSVTPNTGEFNVTDGPQTVTITVTDLCGNSDTTDITITPKPWPNFEINGTVDNDDNNCYCHGDNITLTAVLEDGDIGTTYNGASYQWYKLTSDVADRDDESNWNLIGGATEYSYNVTTSADNSHAGTYRLEITDPKRCKGYAYITICVHPAIEFHLE